MTTNNSDRSKESSAVANTSSGNTTKAENKAFEQEVKDLQRNARPIDNEKWNNASLD